jgi:hypothetical protein
MQATEGNSIASSPGAPIFSMHACIERIGVPRDKANTVYMHDHDL